MSRKQFKTCRKGVWVKFHVEGRMERDYIYQPALRCVLLRE